MRYYLDLELLNNEELKDLKKQIETEIEERKNYNKKCQ